MCTTSYPPGTSSPSLTPRQSSATSAAPTHSAYPASQPPGNGHTTPSITAPHRPAPATSPPAPPRFSLTITIPSKTIQQRTTPRDPPEAQSRLHVRTGHASEDQMCLAVTTTWRNRGVKPGDIRRVFYRQPCLVCILAKRNKDSKLIWSRQPQPPPPTAQPPPNPASPTSPSKPEPLKQTTIDSPIKTAHYPTDNREDSQWAVGECIRYDNVGPISPESIEGYRQFIAFLDTRSKYLFCYPIKTCNEETFLYHLTSRGYKPRILRSDYYTTFRSAKANQFYEDNQCRHESSAPYQQLQNAVERDIQTILSNVSATIHGQDFMRADTWAHTGPDFTTPSHTLSSRTHQPE